MLKQHMHGPVTVDVAKQQAGGAVPTPVAMTGGTLHPPVAVAAHDNILPGRPLEAGLRVRR
jgi:hypothetical protein